MKVNKPRRSETGHAFSVFSEHCERLADMFRPALVSFSATQRLSGGCRLRSWELRRCSTGAQLVILKSSFTEEKIPGTYSKDLRETFTQPYPQSHELITALLMWKVRKVGGLTNGFCDAYFASCFCFSWFLTVNCLQLKQEIGHSEIVRKTAKVIKVQGRSVFAHEHSLKFYQVL